MIVMLSGILLCGGEGSLDSVEVFLPSSGLSCSLPSLPDPRAGHTIDNLLLCGGGEYPALPSNSACLTLSSGEWVTSHTLVSPRYGHTSWATDQGLLLLGGQDHFLESELVSPGEGQGELSFPLQHRTQ